MIRTQLAKKKNELQSLLFPYLHPATTTEKDLINTLRKEICALPLRETVEKDWQNNLNILRQDILNKDPRNFLRWPVILYTMFHECKVEELTYLQNLPNCPVWQRAITESKFGNPRPYPSYKPSSGNLIHHAYSLAHMFQVFDIEIKDLKNIFEFGGGYGSMARLFYNLGFTGQYTIFDLPEFTALQKYYLKSLNPSWNTVLVSDIKDVAQQATVGQIDMVIGTWSLSESPVTVRQEFLDLTAGARYYLIAYQSSFGTTDNIEYFKKFELQHSNYTWTHTSIPHLPGNFYLFGKKN